MGIWIKRFVYLALAVAIAAGFYLALREKPVLVDVFTVEAGPMTVTIDEEGVTRVRDIYVVSSPIAGHLDRTTLEEGEMVLANQTIIASIHPLDPPFLDDRTRRELSAAVQAAEAAVALAEVEYTRAQSALSLATSEYDRAATLAKTNTVSESQLEKAWNELQLHKAQLASTEASIRLRKSELASAEARLMQPGEISGKPSGETCCVSLSSPVDGVILKVLARSEQAVSPGTQIAEIGDPEDMEVLVDVLSSDAAKIQPDSKVIITDWGQDSDISATVRRIDPAAFTKVSSLGIEEQRVNIVLDLDEVPPQLGHGYRILARIAIWSADNVTQLPIGALFRSDGNWSVFAVENNHAVLRTVEVGHMNAVNVEILSGMSEGDQVVLYPNDRMEDGKLIEIR